MPYILKQPGTKILPEGRRQILVYDQKIANDLPLLFSALSELSNSYSEGRWSIKYKRPIGFLLSQTHLFLVTCMQQFLLYGFGFV